MFAASLAPSGWLAYAAFTDGLGTEPVEKIASVTGISTLVFLFITLSITPLRRATGWNVLIRFRRMVGLFAFFYASVHASDYFVFDQSLSPAYIVEDVVEHPWVLFGFTAFVLLIPLAITSTKGWVRRLGGRRWQRLHLLVYPVAVLGVLHYFLAVKRDVSQPVLFAGTLAVVLLSRFVYRSPDRRRGANFRP